MSQATIKESTGRLREWQESRTNERSKSRADGLAGHDSWRALKTVIDFI